MTLTERDHDRTVTVHVGQPVTVSLPENASTGYRWAPADSDPRFVTVQAGAPRYPSGAVGSGGRTEWVLTPIAPGETSVALKLWRSWEGDASVAERFRVGLRIEP